MNCFFQFQDVISQTNFLILKKILLSIKMYRKDFRIFFSVNQYIF